MMMKYKKGSERKISEVLGKMMSKDDRLARQFRTVDIEHLWRAEMGKTISSYTNKVELRRNTLIVFVDSAALREELMYRKEGILEKMNRVFNLIEIKDFIVK